MNLSENGGYTKFTMIYLRLPYLTLLLFNIAMENHNV